MQFVSAHLRRFQFDAWSVLPGKLRKAISIALIPLCLPLILLIRILRPLLLIRFTWLPCRLIGHAVLDPEIYLSKKALGILPEEGALDLYYFESGRHSNAYWRKIVKRNLPVSDFFRILDRLNRRFPGWEPHSRKPHCELHSTADPENLLGLVGPQVRFTAEEQEAGAAYLRRMGIPTDARFVCVQIRDEAHDTQFSPAGLPPGYNEFRNSDIENFVQAFEFLANRGYWIFRMGKVTLQRLQTRNPRIIDYSNSGERTELLDIWLCFNCAFMISTGSGIDALAAIARKPIVCVDHLSYVDIAYYFRNSIVIFKHLHDQKSGKRLTLKEIMALEAQGHYKSSEFYTGRGIEWHLNTPQEIEEAVKELEARLNGNWKELAVDSQLQSAAAKIIENATQYSVQYKGKFVHYIGAHFLRSAPEWLD